MPQAEGDEEPGRLVPDAVSEPEGKQDEPVKGQATAVVTGALSILFGVRHFNFV